MVCFFKCDVYIDDMSYSHIPCVWISPYKSMKSVLGNMIHCFLAESQMRILILLQFA